MIGLDCARRPWLVLATGLFVAGALSAGILYLEVTIDPVELWASPQSRSRQEKEYFDANFSPFYRTAQVIIHAEGLKPVSRERESFCWRRVVFFNALTVDVSSCCVLTFSFLSLRWRPLMEMSHLDLCSATISSWRFFVSKNPSNL